MTWGLGHGDANMQLQLFHIGENSDEAEWLVSMGIVGVEGYVRPSSNCIGPGWMMKHHHLGPRSW